MIKPPIGSLHSPAESGSALRPDDFRKILERERMRADRCDLPFSVLAFTAAQAHVARRELPPLVHYLQGRLRTTDVVGRLDGRRLAALLFDTDHVGAAHLLEDIRRHCPESVGQLAVAIHTHPADSQGPGKSGGAHDLPDDQISSRFGELLFMQPMPAWKRLADLLLASVSLVVLSPVMVVAAVLIKVGSPGPILFCQRRAGLGGQPFVVYKFRTMCDGAAQQQAALRARSEQDGPAFKLKNDPRVTWIGKYLRKSCIDEFPQFWNVLRGEMSIVGPRPLPLDESADCSNWQRRRMDVTPGMTCIWQVSGGMRVSFIEWMRMDLRYIRERTLWHDFKLLVQTARAILFHRASH